MNKISVEINSEVISTQSRDTVLEVLNDQGIEVPTLCHLKGMLPTGACRMCIVEDTESGKLIPSCSSPAWDGMKIETHSPRVTEARKTIVELLQSNHPDDCLYCKRNNNCELQSLSGELCIEERRIFGKKNKLPIDRSGASLVRDPEKCILCGRCVRVCEEIIGVSAIDFANRGSDSVISTSFDKGINLSNCINCGQCIQVCPTAALTEREHSPEILSAISNPNKKVVVQYAPAISVSFAEEFGLPYGEDMNGILNHVLRKLGFDHVFDTSFAADLTIMEESSELIKRIENNENLPLMTSCCPAWVKYAEQYASDFLPNVSSCKSPQQMMGSVIKSYFAEQDNIDSKDIYSVSVMPCTAKKFEGQRKEMTHSGTSDVDAVLTTRELVRLIKQRGINVHKLKPQLTDSPLGTRTSAGKLFATTGGVSEAAIRTAYFKLTGKELIDYKIEAVRGTQGRKETVIKIGDFNLGVAVIHGMNNVKPLLKELREGRDDLHLIEVMACPNGCIGGGGQPINLDKNAVMERMKSIYKIDENDSIKVSHKNPDIIKIYKQYLDKPLSHKSHELLHTAYEKREMPL
ncbi:MAG: NADH-dependent [FeFe] hydrogenase, group A6 [Bacteroidota bacterium]|nr:NADH-dependent [FeFe] hydrogenase, group A6 [Bacteroidota bacterium]